MPFLYDLSASAAGAAEAFPIFLRRDAQHAAKSPPQILLVAKPRETCNALQLRVSRFEPLPGSIDTQFQDVLGR